MNDYVANLLVLFAINALLALSLNLITGYLGLLSVSHGAVFGVGAYAAALFALRFPSLPLLAVVLGGLCSAIASAALGMVTARFTRETFVIATLIVQTVLLAAFRNLESTGGPYGLVGIPRPFLFGHAIVSPSDFLIWSMPAVLIVAAFMCMLDQTPFTRALKAINDNEGLGNVMGKDIARLRVYTIALSGASIGVAGALHALYVSFIEPSSFTIDLSVFALTLVTIGGAGNIIGPISGAVILTATPEMLRWLPISRDGLGYLRQVAYGVTIVSLMRFRPQGLFGRYRFDND
jgi:branched-chain amino acid transport system permease protein